MPMVNPLNSPNVNEVLRDEALRQETLHRQTGYDNEPSSCPQRTRTVLRKLAKLIGGRSE
jgi:hypothetical protein